MKWHLLIFMISFCFITLDVMGQKFPDTWYCVNEGRWQGPNPNGPEDILLQMATYKLTKDTIVNGYNYTELTYTLEKIQSEWALGGIRFNNDSTKIWFKPWCSEGAEDYLLFDYTINVGDELVAFCVGTSDGLCGPIYSADSVVAPMKCIEMSVIDGRKHYLMEANYSSSFGPKARIKWIEGVGTSVGLFAKANSLSPSDENYGGHPLICALKDEQVLFHCPDNKLTNIGHNGIINHCSYIEEVQSAIEIIKTDNPDKLSPRYNILGLLVDETYKGLIIQNGRVKLAL